MGAELGFILTLQGMLYWLESPMHLFSSLGDPLFYLFLVPALYWCIDTGFGLRAGLLLGVSCGLNNACKVIFHAPRPYWISRDVLPLETNNLYSLPSGHSQTSTALLGYIAFWSRRRFVWIAAGILIILVGFSRIFLGVHFPRDVIAGWSFGVIILVMFILVDARGTSYLRSLSTSRQVLLALIVSFLLLALNGAVYAAFGSWSGPVEWMENASAASGSYNPLDPEAALLCGGAFFGLGAGAATMQRLGHFAAGGTLSVRIRRYPVGLIGVIFIWYAFGMIIPGDGTLLDYALGYFRSALWGGWVTLGAPLLFSRLRIG